MAGKGVANGVREAAGVVLKVTGVLSMGYALGAGKGGNVLVMACEWIELDERCDGNELEAGTVENALDAGREDVGRETYPVLKVDIGSGAGIAAGAEVIFDMYDMCM